MAKSLIELKTDLKSLKYQGVNGSEAPYVTKDIRNPESPSRAGQEIFRRVDDTVRIAKAISPTNSRFLENQAKLIQADSSQKLNPLKITAADGKLNFIQKVANTALSIAGTAASTLAQVPLAGTGTRLGIAFRPTNGQAALQGEVITVSDELKKGNLESRQSSLTSVPTNVLVDGLGLKVQNTTGGFQLDQKLTTGSYLPDQYSGRISGITEVKDSKELVDGISKLDSLESPLKANSKNVSTNPYLKTTASEDYSLSSQAISGSTITVPLLGENGNAQYLDLKYSDTQLRKLSQERRLDKYVDSNGVLQNEVEGTLDVNYNLYSGTYTLQSGTNRLLGKQVQQGNSVANFNNDQADRISKLETRGSGSLVDSANADRFDSQTGSSDTDTPFVYTDYKTKVTYTPIEGRYKMGNQGLTKKPTSYKTTLDLSVDKLNQLDIRNSKLEGSEDPSDLIKFYFTVLSPGFDDTYLYFRAYLDSFNDSYQGNWSETQYIGRGEKMQTYDGFSRSISLSFKTAASTREELSPLYKKLIYLASTTAPSYGAGSFMRGTLVRLTVGDYLADTPGVITSVDYKWQTEYPWEIVEDKEENVQQLPHILDCSINFKPIHDFIPEYSSPFISNTRIESSFTI